MKEECDKAMRQGHELIDGSDILPEGRCQDEVLG